MKSLHLPLIVLSVNVGVFVAACPAVQPLPDEPGPDVDPCVGPLVSFVETEPNDGTNQSDHNVVETADGDLEITGVSASCGNDGTAWTGDVDVFEVSYGCGGQASVTLSWSNAHGTTVGGTPADLDYTVLAPELSTTNYASVGYDWLESVPDPQSAAASVEEDPSVSLMGPLRVSVMCWFGDPDQEWTFTIHWDTAGGDDDDSAGDDDDSAGDDDDSVGDDDDSVGDDDDSAGDDDDSAGR